MSPTARIASTLSRLALAGILLPVLVAADAPAVAEVATEAADEAPSSRAFYEGVWLPFDRIEKSAGTVVTFFASREVPATPSDLVAMGLPPQTAQWVPLVRERLEQNPRELAEIRKEFAPGALYVVTVEDGMMRSYSPKGAGEVAPYAIERDRGDEVTIRHFHLDGSSEAWKARRLGPDGMAVRGPDGWSWFVRAPADLAPPVARSADAGSAG